MLQTRTVTPELLELLYRLMEVDLLQPFSLVGGTALALQLGHRESVDIDLFGSLPLEHNEILDALGSIGNVRVKQQSRNILITEVEGIKVDFVSFKYPTLENVKLDNNIRMFGLKDIAAMKISAITQRGSKKDFVDLFYLLKHYTLDEIFEFYETKIRDGSRFLAYKSLHYFEDAEHQPLPLVYETDFSWEICKNTILKEVKSM